MTNKVIKTFVFDKSIRLYLLDNAKMLKEIMAINKSTSMSHNILLAKAISGISLASATLKDKQRISATFTMTNPKHKVYADADHLGNVRGYSSQAFLNSQIHERRLEDIIGSKGFIRVIKGFERNQFTGITDMPNQNVDDDLSHYFKQSEQVDTVIKTKIEFDEDNQVKSSFGIYAQSLPSAPKQLLDEIRDKVNDKTGFIEELISLDEREIGHQLSKFFNTAEVIGRSKVQFFCGCSKEMFYGILYSLDKEELKNYIESNTPLESNCHVCGKVYRFDTSELKTII